jgi:hypothetical protein
MTLANQKSSKNWFTFDITFVALRFWFMITYLDKLVLNQQKYKEKVIEEWKLYGLCVYQLIGLVMKSLEFIND